VTYLKALSQQWPGVTEEKSGNLIQAENWTPGFRWRS